MIVGSALIAAAVLLSTPADLTGGPSARQEVAACTSAESRAFDFWIGQWSIEQRILRADGKWSMFPAKTAVSRAIGGCALLETWEGTVQFFWEGMERPERTQGLSVRAFDPERQEWQVHWMDTRSPRFGPPFTGGFTDGRGEFISRRETPEGPRLSRITFSEITRESVHWDLAVSSDDGRTWTTVWIMEMRRTGA